MSLLTLRRQIFLATKTSPDVLDPGLVAQENILPVLGEVTYTPDVPVYSRVRGGPDVAPIQGQKASRAATVSFQMEFRVTAMGGGVPVIQEPLRACRCAFELANGTAAIGAVGRDQLSTGTVTPAVAGTFTGTLSGTLLIEVIDVVTDTSVDFAATFYPADGTAPVYDQFQQTGASPVSITTVAAGVTVDFGNPGSSTTGIEVGDRFVVGLTSDQQATWSIYPIGKQDQWADIALLQDGRIFYLRNCAGTFTFGTNRADGILLVDFTFTGIMEVPADQNDVPVALIVGGPYDTGTVLSTGATFDDTDSAVVTCISEVAFDAGNTVSPVQCLQETSGYDSFEVTDSVPTVEFDPAAVIFGSNADGIFDNWYKVLTENDTYFMAINFLGDNGRTLRFDFNLSVTGVEPADRDGQVVDSVSGAIVYPDTVVGPAADRPWAFTIL